jgi:hypothetical protein
MSSLDEYAVSLPMTLFFLLGRLDATSRLLRDHCEHVRSTFVTSKIDTEVQLQQVVRIRPSREYLYYFRKQGISTGTKNTQSAIPFNHTSSPATQLPSSQAPKHRAYANRFITPVPTRHPPRPFISHNAAAHSNSHPSPPAHYLPVPPQAPGAAHARTCPRAPDAAVENASAPFPAAVSTLPRAQAAGCSADIRRTGKGRQRACGGRPFRRSSCDATGKSR